MYETNSSDVFKSLLFLTAMRKDLCLWVGEEGKRCRVLMPVGDVVTCRQKMREFPTRNGESGYRSGESSIELCMSWRRRALPDGCCEWPKRFTIAANVYVGTGDGLYHIIRCL